MGSNVVCIRNLNPISWRRVRSRENPGSDVTPNQQTTSQKHGSSALHSWNNRRQLLIFLSCSQFYINHKRYFETHLCKINTLNANRKLLPICVEMTSGPISYALFLLAGWISNDIL